VDPPTNAPSGRGRSIRPQLQRALCRVAFAAPKFLARMIIRRASWMNFIAVQVEIMCTRKFRRIFAKPKQVDHVSSTEDDSSKKILNSQLRARRFFEHLQILNIM
jgi:hypothetical protein